MGMYATLRRLTLQQLADLQAQPELTRRYADPDDGEYGAADWYPAGPMLDLDKSWQLIHFLLVGDPWNGEPPLRDAILGGTPLGGDLGYGPMRYLTPDQVRLVSDSLFEVKEERLRAAFDPAKLAAEEVYPGAWVPRPGPGQPQRGLFGRRQAAMSVDVEEGHRKAMADFLDFAMGKFRALASFYADAARGGDAVLSWLA
jgi:hypothetical protein